MALYGIVSFIYYWGESCVKGKRLSLTIIVGGFFGDEGKGKIAGYLGLADKPSIAVRTGSINAGHTVSFNGKKYKLRILPSAFLSESTRLAVAAGALLRLDVLFEEIKSTSIDVSRLVIDEKTGVITQEHVEREKNDPNLAGKIKSTLQGVGAAMSDRVLRRLKLARDYPELRDYLGDVASLVLSSLDKGERVHVEGTQGYYLSLYHGTYPFVTSRDTTAAGVLSELGVGPKHVDDVIVVFKSYVTRVGGGPLPGELSWEEAKKRGWIEYGSVTGRPRRAAPFNYELASRAVKMNSATQIAITKLDILFPEIKCTKKYEELPVKAKKWIEEVEDKLKTPVTLIGTGEDVECIIDLRRDKGFL